MLEVSHWIVKPLKLYTIHKHYLFETKRIQIIVIYILVEILHLKWKKENNAYIMTNKYCRK